ncbi:MAG: choline TMA-lyase-activating enzyme [Enterobacteriaceae bacterium]
MTSGLQKKGKVFNIQKYSIYDGDGTRTVVFLKGCNWRCAWCSNPEGLESPPQVMYSPQNCTNCGQCIDVCPVNIHYAVRNERGFREHRINRDIDCVGCMKCEEICCTDALHIVGRTMTVEQVMDVVMQDVAFYRTSGGGMTLGGGEATLQIDFVLELMQECKRRMIHTAIETNGSTSLQNYERLAECTDLFLYDLKHIDTHEHKKLLGVGNEAVLRNLERLVELQARVIIRIPIIKGWNDSYSAITGIIEYVMNLAKKGGIERIEFLPYHQFGKNKYAMLDMIYPVEGDPSYSAQELEKLVAFFNTFDFDIRLVKH